MASTSKFSSRIKSFIDSPAGPKTVFFWAPMFKWLLVGAGLKDMNRPADKISIPQNLALTATGFIWVRYSFVIKPVNYALAGVNLFVGATGLYQLTRAINYQMKSPEQKAQYQAQQAAKQASADVKNAAHEAQGKIQSITSDVKDKAESTTQAIKNKISGK